MEFAKQIHEEYCTQGKPTQISVVVDVEALSRDHLGVFLVAFSGIYPSGQPWARTFYTYPKRTTPNTEAWWNGDDQRRSFKDKCLELCSQVDRPYAILQMRDFVNGLYAHFEIAWVSDFATFDVGLVSAMFSEINEMPLYLKSDNSAPSEVIDYPTYLSGLVEELPGSSTRENFKRAKIARPERAADHDTEKDVVTIMDEYQRVLAYQKQVKEDGEVYYNAL